MAVAAGISCAGRHGTSSVYGDSAQDSPFLETPTKIFYLVLGLRKRSFLYGFRLANATHRMSVSALPYSLCGVLDLAVCFESLLYV